MVLPFILCCVPGGGHLRAGFYLNGRSCARYSQLGILHCRTWPILVCAAFSSSFVTRYLRLSIEEVCVESDLEYAAQASFGIG